MAYFAVSLDSLETNRRFAKSIAADYPILSDGSGRVARAYGVAGRLQPWASRYIVYISRDGRVLHVDRSVSAARAGAQIVERLAHLGVARRASAAAGVR